ncbi:galactosyltransferase-related protein [Arenimonas sp.]|uniref:galactosyltransferase-related protein n=1 Tax=Arenimonas sp. TaxID=1872635 RepID=UPI0039E4B8BC
MRVDSVTGGRACEWSDSSALTLTSVFPEVGGRLLRHCIDQWPVSFSDKPRESGGQDPVVSIIVGVRGRGRLEQFRSCLASLRAQVGVATEIVVVEQSWQREFSDIIPSGVVYVHQQSTSQDMPYNRSWALNGGAMVARGRILVLHDADMVLPERAAEEIVRAIDRGVDAVRLPRLLFYLDAESSAAIQRSREITADARMERVIANNRTPVAVTRDAYFAIGGHDERFYGWGAEDDEFMDRLRTRRIGEGAMLPVLHLWHQSAAAGEARSRNSTLLERLRLTAAEDRIAELGDRRIGASVPLAAWPVA